MNLISNHLLTSTNLGQFYDIVRHKTQTEKNIAKKIKNTNCFLLAWCHNEQRKIAYSIYSVYSSVKEIDHRAEEVQLCLSITDKLFYIQDHILKFNSLKSTGTIQAITWNTHTSRMQIRTGIHGANVSEDFYIIPQQKIEESKQKNIEEKEVTTPSL